ncbi:MAG: zinc-binding dehydrogenase [Dehalococcoidia bacterium]
MAEMLAAFFTAPRQVEVRSVAVPTLQGADILIRVHSCSICGSDLHAYRGELPFQPDIPRGHELSGEVVAAADDVQGLAIGDRVAVAATTGCGQCSYCRTGRHQICPRRAFLGITYPGGMAHYVRVPAQAAYKLPDGLDYELAALAEPLAVPIHGLHLVGLSLGERVLVLGCGGVGLLAILAAKAAGAGEVIATYRYPHQGDAALAVGADRVVMATEEGASALAGEVRSDPVDVVVETVGGEADTLQQAVSFVRPGGRVSVLGLFIHPRPFNPFPLALKEVRLVGSVGYCQPGSRSDMELALHVLVSRPEPARRTISHRLPLERAADAFQIATDKSTGSLKVVVTPS